MKPRRLGDEDGFVLATAILVLMLMGVVAIGIITLANSQQRQSGLERSRESSFQITEAAMQGQIFQLGRAWPGSNAPGAPVYPGSCTPASPNTLPCPDAPGIATAHTGPDYQAAGCPAGTPTIPWTTQVRDNGDATATSADVAYYDRTLVEGRPAYDANRDGKLWVRADGVAGCRKQAMVALITQNLVTVSFPRNVITANWFATTNKGRKVILDTKGSATEAADLSLRCAGRPNATAPPNPCAGYERTKGQVSPDRLVYDTTTSPAVGPAQLDSFRLQAQAQGKYFAAGVCPNLTGVAGGVAFAEFPPAGCSPPGGFTATNPGVLIVANGTISFGGNAVFYGLLYAANGTDIDGPVVSITGTAAIRGAVTVDGRGGVSAGASKANIVYDDRAFASVKGFAGAGIVQNSWRLLPDGK